MLSSITSKINNDYNDYLNKKISKNKFLKKYGHLRPSTYDISCNSYEENFQKYSNIASSAAGNTDNCFL